MLHRASDFRFFGGYPIKQNEVDGSCSLYGGKKYIYIYDVDEKSWKTKDRLEDQG
jgi:hypothetical protein